MSVDVVITMGGVGKRFRDVGYDVPKYRILARGRSLFEWSVCSLQSYIDAGSRFVFIVQQGDDARRFIHERARALAIRACEVVEIPGLTDGQATTAMHAAPALSAPDAAVAIFNIDTHVAPHAMALSAVRGDGWVPCFTAPGDKWSFARVLPDGRIVELREKQRISEFATLGLYYFRSFEMFSETYGACFAPGAALEAGEKFIAPMYNVMIARGAEIYMHLVAPSDVVALGTPDDLLRFDPESSPQRVI